MKKAFGLVLAFIFVATGTAPVTAEENNTNSSSVYTLDEEKAKEFEANKDEKIIETPTLVETTL